MQAPTRPGLVKVHAALLLAAAVIMALIGWSASAYFVPVVCLLLQATLLWRGRRFGLFRWIIVVNQVSGLVLIFVLWLGGGLGDIGLDIAGVMLLANLLCGGPLLSILAVAIMPSLHKGRRLFDWFHPQAT